MKSKLEYIVDSVCEKNPLHGKKITKNVGKFDDEYFLRANRFLDRYTVLLKENGKTLDDAIEYYLQMIADVNYETIQFIKSGHYTSTSFAEVNERVYDNPDVMEYYMHGLVLSQFLWAHHYEILLYFNKMLNEHKGNIKNYLEVGGGHGLYISEAVHIIGKECNFNLVDISASSLEMARQMVGSALVNYTLNNVFDYASDRKFDFITMGEVLEHVEEPVKLLQKLHSLVADSGKVFVTTPTNAPAIDHIFLFRNANDVRRVIDVAGFKVEEEKCFYAEDLPADLLEKYKISMMYTALLSKK